MVRPALRVALLRLEQDRMRALNAAIRIRNTLENLLLMHSRKIATTVVVRGALRNMAADVLPFLRKAGKQDAD